MRTKGHLALADLGAVDTDTPSLETQSHLALGGKSPGTATILKLRPLCLCVAKHPTHENSPPTHEPRQLEAGVFPNLLRPNFSSSFQNNAGLCEGLANGKNYLALALPLSPVTFCKQYTGPAGVTCLERPLAST